MAADGSAATASQKKKSQVERTPLEHAHRRVKEQISAVGLNRALEKADRDRVIDYLTGISHLISQAPYVRTQFASEPYATVIALGRAANSANDLFKKPAKPAE